MSSHRDETNFDPPARSDDPVRLAAQKRISEHENAGSPGTYHVGVTVGSFAPTISSGRKPDQTRDFMRSQVDGGCKHLYLLFDPFRTCCVYKLD